MERKIFLEELPTKEGTESKRRQPFIDWKSSIGHKVRFEYDNIKGELEILDYISKGQRIRVKFNNNVVDMSTGLLIKCGLGNLVMRKTKEFKFEIGQVFKDDKRDIVIIDKTYKEDSKIKNKKRKYYKYKCNKCSFECNEHHKGGEYKEELWLDEGSLLKGTGCSCCSNQPKIVVEGINDIPTTAPWMVKYFQGGYEEAKKYTRCSNEKIYPICPDCGRVKDKQIAINNINKNRSINCNCSDGISYPNKFMYNVLEQLYVKFESEYSPDWIKPKRYDFYFEIENNKYIIEMDGGWHYKNNNLSGQSVSDSIIIDEYKDNIAKEHKVSVIRINAYESDLDYIKNSILNSKLIEIFNFDNVNWLKVEVSTLTNRVKQACEYKKNNPNLGTGEIAMLMKLDRSTVISYLKKGAKLNWCDYDSKNEMIKSGKKRTGITKDGKKVEVFKDNVSLGIFKSVVELESLSEDLFGTKFGQSKISANARKNNGKKYKGYTFKYI